MIGLILAGAVAVLVPLAPPSDEVWEITVYDDNRARGEAECRQRVIEYAPATCKVLPESAS